MAVSSRTARLPLIATFGMATVIVPERTPLRFAPSEIRWPAPLVRLIAPPPSTRLALLTVTSTTGPVAPVVWVRVRLALSSWPATAMVALVIASRRYGPAGRVPTAVALVLTCRSTPALSTRPGMLVVTLAAIEPLMPPAPSTSEPVAMLAVTTPPPRLSVAAAMVTRVVRTPPAFSREISRLPTCRV